jgi:ribonuclease BN (tRNA processing enzyme)
MKIALPLAALLLAAPFVNAQGGVTGVFRADEVGFGPWTFNLKAEGPTLTGTISQSGAGTSLTSPTDIYDGAIDGAVISFKADAPGGGKTILFQGALDGDVITFDRSVQMQAGADPGMNGIYGATGATHFTARRVAASAAPAAIPVPTARGAAAAPGALQVVFLGTGTPNADPARSGPAVAVVAGPQAYLVDAGPGVVRRAREASDRTQIVALRAVALNYLFLTHLHSDHTLGYPDLIFTPAVIGRNKPLTVFGPKGTKDMTNHLLAAWTKDMDVRINGLEHGNPEAYKVNVTEIKPGVIHKDANVTVKAFLVPHATWDEAFGYRFETAGRSIVVSGDTKPSSAIVEACNGCDVLVHEVYCAPSSGQASPYYRIAHTSTAELAQIAIQAKPKLLVLYHQLFGACNDATLLQQMQKAYPGAVVSAKDFDIF